MGVTGIRHGGKVSGRQDRECDILLRSVQANSIMKVAATSRVSSAHIFLFWMVSLRSTPPFENVKRLATDYKFGMTFNCESNGSAFIFHHTNL